MTKKTIFVLTIIAVLAIALYKWLTNGNENEEKAVENTEEVTETATNEKQTVEPETRTEEVKENGEDKVENHK